jgi:hypothetical protein
VIERIMADVGNIDRKEQSRVRLILESEIRMVLEDLCRSIADGSEPACSYKPTTNPTPVCPSWRSGKLQTAKAMESSIDARAGPPAPTAAPEPC